jgi:predicted nucleic acid-binding protein
MTYYYLDTNALFKYYRGHGDLRPLPSESGERRVRELVENHGAFVSKLTTLEFIHLLMKNIRRGRLRQKHVRDAVERLRRDINTRPDSGSRPLTLIEFSQALFPRAEELLLMYADRFDVGSTDMLHIALVEQRRRDSLDLMMVTSDRGMINVCHQLELPFIDPQTPPS